MKQQQSINNYAWRWTNLFSMLSLLLLFFFSSCTDEHTNNPTPDGEEKMITFSVKTPSGFIPTTYALTENQENAIETIDVLIFKKDGDDTFKYFSGPHYASIGEADEADEQGKVYTPVTIRIPDGVDIASPDYSVEVFANSREIINTAAGTTGFVNTETRDEVFGKLIVDFSATNGKWISDSRETEYKSIPMHATLGTNAKADLVRMLARINVKNTFNGLEQFSLQSVHLYRHNTKGFLAPLASGTPHVPASVVSTSGLVYDTESNNDYKNEIYTFEALAGSADNFSTNTCLVIGGKYKAESTVYYYRVDFFGKDGENDPETYLPLLRNHSYEVSITKIFGPGYDDPDDAAKSKPVNVEYSIQEWDENSIIDAGYNGQYMVGVSASKFNFDASARGATSGDNILHIQTTYSDGWTAEITDANGDPLADPWLTLINIDGTPATGGNVGSSVVKLQLTSNKGDATSERSALIKLRAGNVVCSVAVTQDCVSTDYTTFQPESNSYIVKTDSKIFIPVSRANASPELGIQLNPSDKFTAGLVWAEGSDATSVIKDIDVYGIGASGYVYVETGAVEGNAVVAIKNTSDEILWSWHIWVTNDTPDVLGPDGFFMDRNLGALNNGNPVQGDLTSFTVDENTYGLYYQWGRKDPFPRSNGLTGSVNRTVYYGSASTGDIKNATSSTLLTSGTQGKQSIQYSVQNPDRFVIVGTGASDGQEWSSQLDGANSNRWEYLNFQSKSVYDPCPPGWRVPIDGIWPAKANGWLNEVTTRAQRNDGYGGVYPAQGLRAITTGSFSAGSLVYVWSASPTSTTQGINLYASTTTLNPSYTTVSGTYRALGASVRCIQEPSTLEVYGLADTYLMDGSTYSFSIYSATPYTIDYSQLGSYIVPGSMTNDGGNAGAAVVSFQAQALIGADQNINLTITNTGGASKTVSFTADMPDPFLNVLTPISDYYKLDGSTHTFNFNTNVPWKVKSVTETFTNGSPDGDLISNDNDLRNTTGNAGQGQSISVTAASAAATGGVVSIVFSTSDGDTDLATLSLPFSALLNGPSDGSSLTWAGSNIYYDSGLEWTDSDGETQTGRLTFDEEDTNAFYQGVYFKWGSLFGVSPTSSSSETTPTNWDSSQTVYPPHGGTATGYSWGDIAYISSTNISSADASNNYLYYRTDDVADDDAVRGDICRWLTLKGWAPGSPGTKWRMPTSSEFGSSSHYAAYNTGSYSAITTTSADGKYVLPSDRPYITRSVTSTTTFPAAGYRGSNGALTSVGTIGYFWSGSPSSSTNGRYLNFYSNGSVYPSSNLSRTSGLPVRCLREN